MKTVANKTASTQAVEVPSLDLKAQFATIRAEIEAAVQNVLESQHFILGPQVTQLEEAMARYTGAKHAVACASGSDALLLALMALRVGPGDEVITTPFTFFATAGAVARLGAKTVFVDIEPDTFNIDPAHIESAITPRTKAIIPVHLFGQCAAMKEIMGIAQRRNIPVIEDAAQSIGAVYGACDANAPLHGKQAGVMGATGIYSFYPAKNLGAYGDAGMVVTNDAALAEMIKVLRVHGGEKKYYHRFVGVNSRLDTLQAAVLLVKLRYLDQWNMARAAVAAEYSRRLAGIDGLRLPLTKPSNTHTFNQYTLRLKRRDDLIRYLKERRIGSMIYYPLCLHLQECFKDLGYRAGDLPVAELASAEAVSIPIYPELAQPQVDHVCDTIREFMNA